MGLKQFFKPDWRKIILTIVLFAWFFLHRYNYIDLFIEKSYFSIGFYITYPLILIFGIEKLQILVFIDKGLLQLHPSLVISGIFALSIYDYLISCFMVWIVGKLMKTDNLKLLSMKQKKITPTGIKIICILTLILAIYEIFIIKIIDKHLAFLILDIAMVLTAIGLWVLEKWAFRGTIVIYILYIIFSLYLENVFGLLVVIFLFYLLGRKDLYEIPIETT